MNAEIRQRAISFILNRWGRLGDLPAVVVPVIWVTVVQSLTVGEESQAAGGAHGLLKDMLLGHGSRTQALREATLKIGFLDKMVPMMRGQERSYATADAYLVVDILKWNIIDAGSMGRFARTWARLIAKAGPEYREPVPREIF